MKSTSTLLQIDEICL